MIASAEILVAIATLCLAHIPSGSTEKITQCQQRLIECYNHKDFFIPGMALTECIKEGKVLK